jgi:hypothetical protein
MKTGAGKLMVGPLLMPGLSFNVSLFLGAALAETAVGITGRDLRDLRRLMKMPAVQIFLGAAAIDGCACPGRPRCRIGHRVDGPTDAVGIAATVIVLLADPRALSIALALTAASVAGRVVAGLAAGGGNGWLVGCRWLILMTPAGHSEPAAQHLRAYSTT